MKNMFVVSREESLTLLGEVKSNTIQRGCVYDPSTIVTGANGMADLKVVNYTFKGDYKVTVFNMIDALSASGDAYRVYTNKKIASVGRSMEQALRYIVLGKTITEDDMDEATAVIKLASEGGVSEATIAQAKAAVTKEDRMTQYSTLLAQSVIAGYMEDFTTEELIKIAIYTLRGFRFDSIYYILDEEAVRAKVTSKVELQYWLNINAIKTACCKGIVMGHAKDVTREDVAPLHITEC